MATASGFSHSWPRGVTAVAAVWARLPKMRKSWPKTSNEWRQREVEH